MIVPILASNRANRVASLVRILRLGGEAVVTRAQVKVQRGANQVERCLFAMARASLKYDVPAASARRRNSKYKSLSGKPPSLFHMANCSAD